jgi:hypothetical protein
VKIHWKIELAGIMAVLTFGPILDALDVSTVLRIIITISAFVGWPLYRKVGATTNVIFALVAIMSLGYFAQEAKELTLQGQKISDTQYFYILAELVGFLLAIYLYFDSCWLYTSTLMYAATCLSEFSGLHGKIL